MEPNTSSTNVTENSPAAAAALKHGHGQGRQPSVRDDQSLLLPPPFSPAPSPGLVPASGPGSGSSSSWCQQIPPSPAVAAAANGSLSVVDAHGTSSQSLLPMVGYDLFGNPEGVSSSAMAALVLPECPSPGSFDFAAGELAAWPSEMSSCFFSFSPSSGDDGLPPLLSSDNLVGFAQPSSDSELAPPLPQSLAENKNPVVVVDGGAPLPPPIVTEDEEVEEEEIDVSEFLVSDPEDQPPNNASSWTPTSPQMGGGGGASASWMAPASTGNNWPPVSALAAASTYTSTMGAGAGSSSNFNGFVQQSSSAVLAPHVPNPQGPLLPVKQEVMESYTHVAARRDPDFISLVDDDDEDESYQDDVLGSPGNSFAAGSWPGSSSTGSFSFAPGSWGDGGSSSIAPGSWGGGGSSSPSFVPGSWGGGSSSSSSPSFDGNMPCFDQNTSIGNYGSSSMMKLSMGGEMPLFTSGLPPLPRAATSSRNGAAIVFTDHEMAIIGKDKKLQQLVRTDRKKVKRILYNRAYSATTKVRKVVHTKNLECMVVTLEEKRKSLREELQSLQEGSAALRAQHMKMQRLIEEMEQQTMIKDAVREVLRADIQKLNHLKLNN